MRALLAGALAGAVVMGVATPAADACSPVPPRWMGTPAGTAIPRTGTLYAIESGVATFDETTGATWKLRPLVVSEDWFGITRLVAIDYQAAGAALELASDHETWRYPVVDAWKPPAEPPRVILTWHQEDANGTCGQGDALVMQLDQAVAAVKVRWRDREGTVDRLLPARTWSGNDDRAGATVVVLGDIPYAQLFDPARLRLGGALALTAIRLDGSEIAIGGIPDWIDLDDYPAVPDGRPMILASAVEPVVPGPTKTHAARELVSPWMGVVIVVLMIGVGAVSWRTASRAQRRVR